jgi:hypothetical protein
MTATVTSLPVWPADVPVHPAAELFPLMGGAEFDELVKDIRENGLVTPIVRTPDGLILDGRNRYRACSAAGVRPVYQEHGGEPWRFVISTNLHRRHLTDSQRAMVAGRIAERAHGRPKNRPDGQFSEEGAAEPPTQPEAAAMLNVSERQVRRARTVVKDGTPDLIAAVEAGAVPVSTAERLTVRPAEEQNTFAVRAMTGGKAVAAPRDVERSTEAGKPVDATPAKQKRRPLPEVANDLGWEMRKQAEKLARLLDDDRFAKNEEQAALALRGHCSS